MANVPHRPPSSNPGPGSGSSGTWIDLIAFIGVLALGGILITFGHVAVDTLATVCVALGGLYAVWRLRPPDDPPSS